jgi:hypothetical protein
MPREELERDVRFLALDVLALVNEAKHVPEGLEKAKRNLQEALKALRPEPQTAEASA